MIQMNDLQPREKILVTIGPTNVPKTATALLYMARKEVSEHPALQGQSKRPYIQGLCSIPSCLISTQRLVEYPLVKALWG